MIFEQIKKYPEPQPVTTTYYGSSLQKTEAEKTAWAQECQEALLIALSILKPGDTVLLKEPRQSTRVIIHSFLTDPIAIFPYKEKPCFVMARNEQYPIAGATRYSLDELDLSSLQSEGTQNANPAI